MTTLANERSLSGGTSTFPQVLKLARECRLTSDPIVRQRLAGCYAKGEILKYLGFRIQTALRKGMSDPEILGHQALLLADADGDRRSGRDGPGSSGHAAGRRRAGRGLLAATVPERTIAPDRRRQR